MQGSGWNIYQLFVEARRFFFFEVSRVEAILGAPSDMHRDTAPFYTRRQSRKFRGGKLRGCGHRDRVSYARS